MLAEGRDLCHEFGQFWGLVESHLLKCEKRRLVDPQLRLSSISLEQPAILSKICQLFWYWTVVLCMSRSVTANEPFRAKRWSTPDSHINCIEASHRPVSLFHKVKTIWRCADSATGFGTTRSNIGQLTTYIYVAFLNYHSMDNLNFAHPRTPHHY